MFKYWQLSPKNKRKWFLSTRVLFPLTKGEKKNGYDLGSDSTLFKCAIISSFIRKWPTRHSFSHSFWIDQSSFGFATYVSIVLPVPFDGVRRFWNSILHTFAIASSPKGEGGSSSSVPKVTKPTCRRRASNWGSCAYD